MDESPHTQVTEREQDSVSTKPSQEDLPPGLTHRLRFEQFRQIAMLSVAAVGGVLILLQAGYIESSFRSGAVVALFAVSAALSLFGQEKLIDGLEAGRGWTRAARVYRLLSVALLGAGAGLLIGIVL